MPFLRFSRARYPYVCAQCSARIGRRQPYFRDEPHPFARMRGQTTTRQLCLVCVLGAKSAREFVDSLEDPNQLPLGFELTANGFLRFPPRVELVNITPQILKLLSEAPERMRDVTPSFFEELVSDRLSAMGFDLARVGTSTFQKDGGVDIIAWPRSSIVPFFVAVQVKHTALAKHKIGPQPVRDLLGTVQMHGFNMGLLVTNTTFSPDAKWVAEQKALLLRLRDLEDLRRWLRDEFLKEYEWRNLPKEIELCPGVRFTLPQ